MHKLTVLAVCLTMTGCAKDFSDKSGDNDLISTAHAATAKPTSAADRMPTLEGVLARHFEALGGENNLRTAKTMMYSGTYTQAGKTTKVAKYYQRAGHKFRMEKQNDEKSKLMIVNGDQVSLTINGKAEELPAAKMAKMVRYGDMDDVLLTYQQGGQKVRLLGKSEVKGKPAYELEIVRSAHETELRYLDAASYLESKRVVSWQHEGKSGKTVVYFSDYRDVGNGMMVNFHADYESEKGPGQFVLDAASYNEPMDAARFQIPNS